MGKLTKIKTTILKICGTFQYSKDNPKFTREQLTQFWSSGEPIEYNGKQYRVGKMSYGDYFLEPWGKELPETKGFPAGTLWLSTTEKDKNLLEVSYEL